MRQLSLRFQIIENCQNFYLSNSFFSFTKYLIVDTGLRFPTQVRISNSQQFWQNFFLKNFSSNYNWIVEKKKELIIVKFLTLFNLFLFFRKNMQLLLTYIPIIMIGCFSSQYIIRFNKLRMFISLYNKLGLFSIWQLKNLLILVLKKHSILLCQQLNFQLPLYHFFHLLRIKRVNKI